MTALQPIKFDSPAHYQISVAGWLSPELIDSVGTMKYRVNNDPKSKKSHLTVSVKDQAQLNGILSTLYNNHHVILRLECVSHGPDHGVIKEDTFQT